MPTLLACLNFIYQETKFFNQNNWLWLLFFKVTMKWSFREQSKYLISSKFYKAITSIGSALSPSLCKRLIVSKEEFCQNNDCMTHSHKRRQCHPPVVIISNTQPLSLSLLANDAQSIHCILKRPHLHTT